GPFCLLLSRLGRGRSMLPRGLGAGLGLGLDLGSVVALGGRLQRGNGVADRGAVGLRDLVAIFLQGLFGRMDKRLGLVADFHQLPALLVRLGIGLGILDPLLDVGVGQAARSLDRKSVV